MTAREWAALVATVLGIAGVLGLYVRKLVGPAVRSAVRDAATQREVTFADRVFEAMQDRGPVIKAWLEGPQMFQNELHEARETTRSVQKNTGKLQSLEMSIASLVDMPHSIDRLAAAVAGVERAVDKLSGDHQKANERLSDKLEKTSADVNNMQGQLKAMYDGPERRRSVRRAIDVPE